MTIKIFVSKGRITRYTPNIQLWGGGLNKFNKLSPLTCICNYEYTFLNRLTLKVP